jgi:hypothetical protein
MLKVLLILTGILNLLFGVFPAFLGYQLHGLIDLSEPVRRLAEALNVGCTLTIFFLAYACLVRGKEVMATGLGATVLGLGALIYLSRAAEEFIWFDGNITILGACLAAGLLHAFLMLTVRMKRAEM